MLSKRLKLVAALLFGASIAAWLGELHWAAELFVHFIPHYALTAAVLCIAFLACRNRLWAAGCAVLALIQLGTIVPGTDAAAANAPADELTLVQFNVNFRNTDPERVMAWIRQQDADVVILLEVPPQWEGALNTLRERYPHQALQLTDSPFGIALLSRLTPSALRIDTLPGLSYPHITLDTMSAKAGVPLRIVGVHPPPPIAHELWAARNEQLLTLARHSASEHSRHHIIAGDFNVTPWAALYRNLLNLGFADARAGAAVQNTWPSAPGSWLWGIAIDHTLVSSGARIVERVVGPDLGSDHRPVKSRIGVHRIGSR